MADSLELIRWEDSFGCSARWQEIPTECPEPVICESVGWVVLENERLVVVVPHRHQANGDCAAHGCGDMTIPKAAIVERRVLQ